MPDALLDISRQCCDADSYINIGYLCAKADMCYNELRPVGAIYWFSLPFRLALPLDILVLLQMALFLTAAISLLLVFIEKQKHQRDIAFKKLSVFTAWTISVAVCIFWILPTFFSSLSDTPASLVFLEAIVLALLAAQRNSAALFLLAGILLGITSLLRTSYFHPTNVSMILLAIASTFLWIRQKKKLAAVPQWKHILLFACYLPISVQYWVNWKYFDEFSFVPSAYGKFAWVLHLQSNGAAYDTVLPQTGYYWSPVCNNAHGIMPDVMTGNIQGVACMLTNRFWFYMGSYAAKTYLGQGGRNFMDQVAVTPNGGLALHDMEYTPDTVPAPDSNEKAPAFSRQTGKAAHINISSIMPLPSGSYRFSIWLWSDNPASLDLQATNRQLLADKEAVAFGKMTKTDNINVWHVELPQEPRRFFFDIDKPENGYVDLQLGWFSDPGEQTLLSRSFHAWDGTLEPSANATGHKIYNHPAMGLVGTPDGYASERHFSYVLLLMNTAAVVMALLFLFNEWRHKKSAVSLSLAGLVLSMLGQSLLVIAEQRFTQGLHLLIWLLAIIFLFDQYAKVQEKQQNPLKILSPCKKT